MNTLKRSLGLALGATLLASSTLIAAEKAAPLPAGKPASVKKAQAEDTTLLWIGGAAIAITGIALAVSDDDNNNTTTPPATSTGTTG